jgi:hypothetical protein
MTDAEIYPTIAVEGACDHNFGRPFDKNPYCRENAPEEWESWREGWLLAAEFEQLRGDEERRRWLVDAA